MKTRTVDFARYSSIRIGPVAKVRVVERGERVPEGHFLVGGANNLLIGPHPPPLAMLGKDFSCCRLEGEQLIIGAATPTGRILSFCKKHDLGGFEFVAKLPGTLGGMVAMNAGVKAHETFNRLLWVETDAGRIEKGALSYGYRYADLPGAVYAAAFEVKRGFDEALAGALNALRANQPKEPSAGSAFKNPPGDYAGRLIEAVGLKGYRLGGMAFSERHANFLVNLGGGTFEEAIRLLQTAESRVYEKFGIALQREVICLDAGLIHN
ncbi:MAG: UDP-N-acetylmuramate dehydrogenase [Epsilonproteobacteria bacterium]|nr:UDP-N-acetylmuramate dehydrogenase [Campylobacterota bacterium]